MSHHEYVYAKKLYEMDPPFYGLLMAAMLKADPDNQKKLHEAWPEKFMELCQRDVAPSGLLPGEQLLRNIPSPHRGPDRRKDEGED